MLIVIILFLIFFNTSLCNPQDVVTIFCTYLPHEEILTATALCGGTVYDEKFVVTTKEKSSLWIFISGGTLSFNQAKKPIIQNNTSIYYR